MPRTPQVPRINDVNGLGHPIYPILPEIPFTQGNIWHVRPYKGSDVNASGKSPESAFRTLKRALAAATANQNDIVYLYSESNTGSATTDYQGALLDWNKDMVHLVGINSGVLFSPRSRIAFASTYNTATDLFKVSANGCLIKGIEFFMGVAGTLPTGCVTVTGNHNHFKNCHIAGFGGAAGANDIANAYSLNLNGAKENLFDDCVIGVDTIALGATASNSQIYVQGYATRNIFRNCKIVTYVAGSATNHCFLRGSATHALDRFIAFENCFFCNPTDAASLALTYAFVLAAGSGGSIHLTGGTRQFGCTGWIGSASCSVYCDNFATASATTQGLMTAVHN